MDWLTAAGNAPFVIALLVMLGLASVELVALLTGFSLHDAVDKLVVGHAHLDGFDHGHGHGGMDATTGGHDAPGLIGRFLAWMYVGKVPVLMILIVLLTVFGAFGLLAQALVASVIGRPLPAILAAPAMLLLCLPVVRGTVGVLARIMPGDESSAIDPKALVGRTATVTGGVARAGMPAQARVADAFGTDHYVLVEPEDGADSFASGTVVLLVRQVGGSRFSAIANPNQALVDPPGH
jgi:hypothetical protein